MAAAAVLPSPNLVERVSSLPLVSSTYGLVWSVYATTKHTHPYLRSVCEAAEQGVRSLGSAVLVTASPILHRLEPQLAVANVLACKGLDRIERTLPILHRPPEQIVSSAKVAVSDTLSSAVERTRTAVLESRVARLVSSGVDTALSTSESLVDQYLPAPEEEEELEPEAQSARGRRSAAPTYSVRLGCLSARLRKRTYSRAASTLQRSRELMKELQSPAELIQYGRKNIRGANQKLNALWRSGGPNPEPGPGAEGPESRTLALARSLSQQLQTSCLVLVYSLQGRPGPAVRLERVRESLDDVMDYMVNNTPLNWLVGPFYPRMVAVETPAPSGPPALLPADAEPPPQDDS